MLLWAKGGEDVLYAGGAVRGTRRIEPFENLGHEQMGVSLAIVARNSLTVFRLTATADLLPDETTQRRGRQDNSFPLTVIS